MGKLLYCLCSNGRTKYWVAAWTIMEIFFLGLAIAGTVLNNKTNNERTFGLMLGGWIIFGVFFLIGLLFFCFVFVCTTIDYAIDPGESHYSPCSVFSILCGGEDDEFW